MAALALPSVRSILPTLRFSYSRGIFASAVVPAFLAPTTQWALPTFQSLLELFPPWLLAVPKKKTSHSRKSMRSANKGLKDKENLVHCPGCGAPKLAHHLCSNCYSQLSRGWKAKAREEAQSGVSES